MKDDDDNPDLQPLNSVLGTPQWDEKLMAKDIVRYATNMGFCSVCGQYNGVILGSPMEMCAGRYDKPHTQKAMLTSEWTLRRVKEMKKEFNKRALKRLIHE